MKTFERMWEYESIPSDTSRRHAPALVEGDVEHTYVSEPSYRAQSGAQRAGGTPLVCTAVAILVFCGQVFLSGAASFIPLAIRQTVLTLYPSLVYVLLLLALYKSCRRWGAVGAWVAVGMSVALCLPYFRDGVMSEFVTLALLVLALSDADFQPLVRTFLWAILAALAVIVVMDALCLTNSVWFKPNGYWAYSYGTGHPNTFGALLYGTITAMVLAIDRDRYRLPLFVCCAATMLFTFLALSCRSAAVIELVLLLALIAEWAFPTGMRRVESSGALNAFVAVGAVTLALVILAGTRWYDGADVLFGLVDRFTNMRVSHGHNAYQALDGFTLFGRQVSFPPFEESYMRSVPHILVDSAYVHFGLISGLVPGACLLVLLCRSAYVSMGRAGTGLLWVILGLNALYCAIERYPTLIIYNCVLPVLAWGIASRAETEDARKSGVRVSLDTGVGRVALPRPGSVEHVLGIALYCALLGFLVFQAATNGTGATDVSAELPRSVQVSCSDGPIAEGLRAVMGSAGGNVALGNSQVVKVDFSEGEQVCSQGFGSNMYGSIRKSGTRGDATRYFMPLARDDAEQQQCGMYLRTPGRGVPGSQLGRWAVCVMDYTSGEPRRASVWLELGEDGRATFGSGKLDATAAEASDLKSRERKGAWFITDRDGATYVRCFFGDEWLEIAMEERGG